MALPVHPELLRNAESQALVNEKADLSATLRDMVNCPQRSDLTFLTKDGQIVHASRVLVSSRCPVLKSMLNNGMLESKLTEIKLPQVSSQVLLSILEFLYTAELVSYRPQSWEMGFEIISAAQFFILPNLEIIVREFLSTEATKAIKSSEKHTIMEMLSIALEFQKFWKVKDTILETLVDRLGDDWFEENYPQSLSENAVDYILSKRGNFKTDSPEPEGQKGQDAQSLEEYLLFRQIVLWQAYQKVALSDGLTRKQVRTALPYSKDPIVLWGLLFQAGAAVSLVKTTSGLSPLKKKQKITSGDITPMISSSQDSVSVLKALLEDEGAKKSLERLLVHINWTRIPVYLLGKIVEPLKLIPSSDLFNVLAFHAFRRPMRLESPECNWKHGAALRSKNGQIICKATNEVGFAIDSNPMLRSYGMYEWHFDVKTASEDFVELGFIHGCEKHPIREDELKFEGRLSHQSRARVLIVNNKERKAYMSWISDDGTKKTKVLNGSPMTRSPIKFQLVVPERKCWLRFGDSLEWFGDSFEEAWTELPDAIYYPAVSFGTSLKGSVQLRLVHGFDYL